MKALIESKINAMYHSLSSHGHGSGSWFSGFQKSPSKTYQNALASSWNNYYDNKLTFNELVEQIKIASNSALESISSSTENYNIRVSISDLIATIDEYQSQAVTQIRSAQDSLIASTATSNHEHISSSFEIVESSSNLASIQRLEAEVAELKRENRQLHLLLEESHAHEFQHEQTKKILATVREEREKFYSENERLTGLVRSLETRVEQLDKEVIEQDERNTNLTNAGSHLIDAGVQFGQFFLPRRGVGYPNFLWASPISNTSRLAITSGAIESSSDSQEGVSLDV